MTSDCFLLQVFPHPLSERTWPFKVISLPQMIILNPCWYWSINLYYRKPDMCKTKLIPSVPPACFPLNKKIWNLSLHIAFLMWMASVEGAGVETSRSSLMKFLWPAIIHLVSATLREPSFPMQMSAVKLKQWDVFFLPTR